MAIASTDAPVIPAATEGNQPPAVVPDTARDNQRATLQDAKDNGYEPKIQTVYIINNQWGERQYYTNDRKDAETRLIELSAGKAGYSIPPTGIPEYTIHEASAIETDNYRPDEVVPNEDRVRDINKTKK